MLIITKSVCKIKMKKQIMKLVIAIVWLIVTVVGLLLLFT